MKAGWERTTLGVAFTTVTGSTPPKSNKGFYGDFMPLVKPPELRDSELDSAEDGLSEAGAAIARTAPLNSLLVSCIGNLGKVGLNTIPVAFNQQINAIFPDETKALPSFMFYQVLSCSFKEQLASLASGTTVPIVNKSKFNSIEIVLPPLPEQQRIVGILDEAFEAIAAARANAVQNRQNARALFESYLQSVFSQRGEGWVETTVGHQVDFLAGFAFKSSEYTDSEEGVRLVRGDNIVQGELRWVGVKRWPINDAPKYSQFFFNENDVVLAMDRPWVAAGLKVAFITKSDLPSLQVQRTARLRAKSTIHWKYLFHMLRSPEYVSYLLDGQTGLGVPHISGKQILSFEFPLPPLNEQQSIVQRLDALWEDTQRLESLYQRKIEALDELKQSLLQQAFSGNL